MYSLAKRMGYTAHLKTTGAHAPMSDRYAEYENEYSEKIRFNSSRHARELNRYTGRVGAVALLILIFATQAKKDSMLRAEVPIWGRYIRKKTKDAYNEFIGLF